MFPEIKTILYHGTVSEINKKVIDSDQGALGGNTFVDICENKEINAIVFRIMKKPQRIYEGEWGKYESMDIYWKNDECLVIDSVEYMIK